MTTRAKSRLYLIAAIVTVPPFLITLILVVGSVNPMGKVFLTPFEIVNETDDSLYVTPIGAIGKRGDRALLPLSFSEAIYFIKPHSSEIPLPVRSTLSLTYDWDDIQVSEILGRKSDGEHRYLKTGLDPVKATPGPG